MLIACVHEEIPEHKPEQEPQTPIAPMTIKITASPERPGTPESKVTLEGTTVVWNSGDSFIAVSEDGGNWTMKLTEGAGTSSGTFEGQSETGTVPGAGTMGIYPSTAFASFASGAMTITIPEVQHYTQSSFDPSSNIMVGNISSDGDGYTCSFKNLMGVLKLTLTGEDEYISTIAVSDKAGKALWGNATLPAENFEEGVNVDQITGGSTITLECKGVELTSTPTDFYITVPVGAFGSGFEVSVTTLDQREAKVTAKAANLISRSRIKAMPKLAISGFEISEFNIQNAAVEAYMGKSGDPEFFVPTKIGSLVIKSGGNTLIDNSITNNTAFIGQDRPLYKSIEWAGEADATYAVTFTDETGSREIFTDRSVKGPKYEFQNLVPGHTYAYVVKEGGNVISAGKFKAAGQVRMVTIEDSWNYRDLGGWKSTLGGTVRYEMIYRGSSLNGKWQKEIKSYARRDAVNPADYVFGEISRQQVRDMGIKAELDLRATIAQESKPAESKPVHENALGQNNTGISDWIYYQNSTGGAQTSPLTDNAVVTDVAWIIDQVLNDIPVAFHCKSGADRTGCVSMVLLSLLGVSPGDICRDYELTTFSREYTVLQGKAEFRTKKANDINSDYKFFCSGFTTLTPGGKSDATQQEKAYYYLNQQFSGKYIPAATLDAFISKMLGMEYTHPSSWTWAR